MEFLLQAYQGLNDVLKYIAGILLIMIFYVLGQIPLLGVTYFALNNGETTNAKINEFGTTNDFSLLGIDANFGFFLMLCLFLFASIGFLIALKIHKKKLLDVLTTRPTFDWSRYFYGFTIWLLLSIGFEVISYLIEPSNYIWDFQFGRFFILILLSIAFLPIQTGLEEVVFRGYLSQGMYLWTKNVAISMVVPTLLFALVHGTNPEVTKFGVLPMAIYYIGAGLFLAFLTYIDKGLELAMGVHFATNFYGAVFVTYQGAVLQTYSIAKMQNTNAWIMSLIFFVAAAIFLILSMKKYKWNFTK